MMKYELRKLTSADAKDLAKSANNPNVSRYLRNVFPYPYSIQDAIDYINFATGSKGELIYGIIIDGKASGCVCARFRSDVNSKSCGFGYWLAEEHWGKGIMTAVVKEFCKFIFDNYDIIRIDAGVCAENIGSRKVLEKVGFVLEGLCRQKVYKNGQFMDEAVYAIIRDDLQR